MNCKVPWKPIKTAFLARMAVRLSKIVLPDTIRPESVRTLVLYVQGPLIIIIRYKTLWSIIGACVKDNAFLVHVYR